MEKNRTILQLFEDRQDEFLQHMKRNYLWEMSVI